MRPRIEDIDGHPERPNDSSYLLLFYDQHGRCVAREQQSFSDPQRAIARASDIFQRIGRLGEVVVRQADEVLYSVARRRPCAGEA